MVTIYLDSNGATTALPECQQPGSLILDLILLWILCCRFWSVV